MDNKSTHFVFDGKKIVISPDLHPIVPFLQEIEKEIETVLGFDKKLRSIREQYLETVNFIEFLAGKLKENSIDFKYDLSEDPATIADKLKMELPVRSQMIVLFAYLEVLLCLYSAYENNTDDEDKIRKLVMNQENIKSFMKNFCVSVENEWGKKNEERLKHIKAEDLRSLRNSLTHFFSVGNGLGISYSHLDEKSRRLEKATKHKAKLISPDDLNEIIKGATTLIIKKWSKDCLDCHAKNSNDFKERILCVRNVINKYGVIIVRENQINI